MLNFLLHLFGATSGKLALRTAITLAVHAEFTKNGKDTLTEEDVCNAVFHALRL